MQIFPALKLPSEENASATGSCSEVKNDNHPIVLPFTEITRRKYY